MKRVGLIGHPVAHSVSAAFQQAAFDSLGMDIAYEAWDTLPEGLEQRMAGMRDEGVVGANVTVPHKESVIPFLEMVEQDAATIGAVNTIVHRLGTLAGHNTDALGFKLACAAAGIDIAARPAVVVGAGGAARAIVYALSELDPRSILVLNRNVDRARKVAVDFGVGCDSLAEAPASVFRTARLLVNATSVGMAGGATGTPIDIALISPSCTVVDIVANPLETELVKQARSAGCQALGGLPMLVYQGAESFRLWTGAEPPLKIMMEAAERATSESSSPQI
ncbi:MAG TPA: shikimate dehydrogenase [Dehalococcoidia bacterium]|nr:shikimate dehydrogenase [Dehalococcoidia bacterium]